MSEKMKCDYCENTSPITPTARYEIERDGLYIICKNCWTGRGWKRNRNNTRRDDHYLLSK